MASGELIVKGGFIVDPTRKIDGDVGDIAIKDGKIVWADYKAKTKEQAADVLKVLAARNG